MILHNYQKIKPYKLAVLFNKLNNCTLGIDNLQIITEADDMINRPKNNFADIAHKMLNSINGKTLIEKGLHPDEIGYEKFVNQLLTQQADFLKRNINKDIDR